MTKIYWGPVKWVDAWLEKKWHPENLFETGKRITVGIQEGWEVPVIDITPKQLEAGD